MKNKKTVYLVLPVVVGLWALVIYKVVQIYSASEEKVTSANAFIPPVLISSAADTFSIAADYIDPFLGRSIVKSDHKASEPTQLPKKIMEPLKWPAIAYGGMIKSRKSNDQLCMVVINGQSNFMKEGDITKDVQLKKVYKDSIEVVFQKEKRMVRK